MSCANCVKIKIDILWMLKMQINMLPPNSRNAHNLANVLAMVIAVLDRCSDGRNILPEYEVTIDRVYEKARTFLMDQVISAEAWHKEDIVLSD